eukprot:jgi/Mesvir1/26458/Mv16133-RA.1
MATKSPKKAPAKKKGAATNNPADFVTPEMLKRAEAEILALQRQLADRQHEVMRARTEEKEWREKVRAMHSLLDEQKEGTLDITTDMSRQYKSMQEQLIRRIDELEEKNAVLKEQLDLKQLTIDELLMEKDNMNVAHERTVGELRSKMEEMAQEFSDMLKETLDNMTARVVNAESRPEQGLWDDG